jgi:hypothetical protein
MYYKEFIMTILVYIHIYIFAALSDQSCATGMAYGANRMEALIGKDDQSHTPLGVLDDECILHHTVRYVIIKAEGKEGQVGLDWKLAG